MIKILIISAVITQLGGWVSLIFAATAVVVCMVALGKHDIDWFEMVSSYS